MEKKEIGRGIYRMSRTLEAVHEELMENGGELTPEISQAMEDAEVTAMDVVEGIFTLQAKAKDEEAAIAAEIKRLQALKKARTNAIESLKGYLLNFMVKAGAERLETPFVKVSVAAGRESVACEEDKLIASAFSPAMDEALAALPEYIDCELKVNKTKLLAYLKKDGAIIPTYKEGEVDIPVANIVRNPYLLFK